MLMKAEADFTRFSLFSFGAALKKSESFSLEKKPSHRVSFGDLFPFNLKELVRPRPSLVSPTPYF